MALIYRVLAGPFEPSLIEACGYLNRPYELFSYTAIKGLVIEWAVRRINNTDHRSRIYNQDWQVRFSAIRRV